MIGLDTNVIVRYLAQDDPVQSARANLLFERELTQADRGFLSVVAMVETIWVLERSYGVARAELADLIEGLLSADALVVEFEQDVFDAMIALRAGTNSFSDAMIASLGIRAGCSTTVTFDVAASRSPGFSLLSRQRKRK